MKTGRNFIIAAVLVILVIVAIAIILGWQLGHASYKWVGIGAGILSVLIVFCAQAGYCRRKEKQVIVGHGPGCPASGFKFSKFNNEEMCNGHKLNRTYAAKLHPQRNPGCPDLSEELFTASNHICSLINDESAKNLPSVISLESDVPEPTVMETVGLIFKEIGNFFSGSLDDMAKSAKAAKEDTKFEINNFVQGKTHQTKAAVQERMDNVKDSVQYNTQQVRDAIQGKANQFKVAVQERMDNVGNAIQGTVDQVNYAIGKKVDTMQTAFDNTTLGKSMDKMHNRVEHMLFEKESPHVVHDAYTGEITSSIEPTVIDLPTNPIHDLPDDVFDLNKDSTK